MFFDIYSGLCKSKGLSTYKVCTDIGLNRSAVAKWKKGALPNSSTLNSIAEYFGVSTDFLLGKDSEQKEKPAPEVGNGLSEKDMRILAKIMALPDDKFDDAMDYLDYLISKGEKK